MKKITIIIAFIVCFYSCKKDSKKESLPLQDINLVINSTLEIDSVSIKSVESKKEIFSSNASLLNDTLKFHMRDTLNDLYLINFYSSKHLPRLPIWLDGEKVIIDIEIGKYAKISKVKNSPLYLHTQEYSLKLEKLYEDSEINKEVIDEYLFKEIKRNLNSPFAFVPAEIFIYNNQDNPKKLKKLDSLLAHLPSSLKKHPLNIHSRINKTLNK